MNNAPTVLAFDEAIAAAHIAELQRQNAMLLQEIKVLSKRGGYTASDMLNHAISCRATFALTLLPILEAQPNPTETLSGAIGILRAASRLAVEGVTEAVSK